MTWQDDKLLTEGLQAVLASDAGRMRFCTAALAVGVDDDSMRLVILRVMPYALYLRTEHWRETSRQAKQRAAGRCQLCNREGRLETHHRTYANRGAEEAIDLLVLCDKCHEKFHHDLPKEEQPPAISGMTEEEEIAWLSNMIEQKRREMGIKP